MIYEKINLISEMLDTILNLKCVYIEYSPNNLSDLKKIMPPIFTHNEKEFNRFLKLLFETKEKHIYFIEDIIFGNYIIICLDEKKKHYLFIGPYMLTNNHDHLLNDFKEYNISDLELELIKKYHISMPFISKSKMTSIVSVIKNNIYGEDVNFKYIFKSNIKKTNLIGYSSERVSFESLNHKFIEEVSDLEYKLLSYVQLGSKVKSMKIIDKILDLYFIDDNTYNLRNCKNKLIYYNTLLSKTVKNKGVSNISVENLFKEYLDKIELANSIADTKNILSYMVIDYCFLISEFNVKHLSSLVRKVIDYINLNIENNLSVNQIANVFYISPTYLSRLFKKETGISVIEYINKLRIKHATFLLRDTYLSIQDIGRVIGINDINYFSRLFKKYMNETPTQYRKNFKQKIVAK